VEQLEPRVLFSVDITGGLLSGPGLTDTDHSPDTQPENHQLLDGSPAIPTEETPTQPGPAPRLVFIDEGVAEFELLRSSLQQHPNIVVTTLDTTVSGLEVITGTLQQFNAVNEVHVISHSDGSSVRLGNDLIDEQDLTDHQTEVAEWATSLTSDADILLYGCNLAATDAGHALMQRLANITGADVAASDDQTGPAELNADGQLEFSIGKVESQSLLTDNIVSNWQKTLATITVTDNGDTVNGDTSSISALISDPGPNGLISLREAIQASNNTPGSEIFLPAADYFITSTGPETENAAADGDLDIKQDLTIRGAGQGLTTIHGLDNNRLFQVHQGTVEFVDLTIDNDSNSTGGAIEHTNGTTSLLRVTVSNFDARSSFNIGGGINVTGGVVNIDESLFKDNRAGNGGGAIYIANNGDVTIKNSKFTLNRSDNDGGAIDNRGQLAVHNTEFLSNTTDDDGSAISATGTTVIENSKFSLNISTGGASAVVNRGDMEVTGSYFHSNESGSSSGALINNGTMKLSDSTFYKNTSVNGGGAFGTSLGGSGTLNNVTFNENISGEDGGAVHIIDGTVTISNSTFYNNYSNQSAGAIAVQVGSASVYNSIFSQNGSATGPKHLQGNYSDGFNLFDNTPANYDPIGDLINANANLGTLQDNGGPVPTMALLDYSDAIDSGKGIRGPDATGTPSNEFIDIGAYEYRGTTPVSKVYWTDTDENSIYRANEDGSSPHSLWAMQKIANTSMMPQDIEYDSNNNQLFWTESNGNLGNLVVADIDGQNTSIAVNNNMDNQVLAPYGIAIDSANNTLYLMSDAHIGNSVLGTANKVLQYQINGSNLNYMDTPFSAVYTNSNPMYEPRDLEHYQSSSGDEWFAWTEHGGPLLSPGIALYNLSTGDFYRLADTSGNDIPNGVSWNPLTDEVLVADTSANLGAVTYNPSSGNAEISIPFQPTGSSLGTSGIARDPLTGTVWHTRNPGTVGNGTIWTSNSNLQNNTVSLSNLSAPGAIALSPVTAINQVNATPVLSTNTGINTAEGTSHILSPAELSTTDTDTVPADLTYTITTQPTVGHLAYTSAPATAINSFSQKDIDDGLVTYVHDDSESVNDSFVFDVSDGNSGDTGVTTNIIITPVNENPPVVPDGNIQLNEGCCFCYAAWERLDQRPAKWHLYLPARWL